MNRRNAGWLIAGVVLLIAAAVTAAVARRACEESTDVSVGPERDADLRQSSAA